MSKQKSDDRFGSSDCYTPGPWAYKRDLWIGKDGKGEIANCCASYELENCTRKEAEANARLIVAAPELLEACRAADRILAEIADHCFRHEPAMAPVTVVKQIRDAIAKATGV